MILDEIHVRNHVHEDTVYVALSDLAMHLANAAREFYLEAMEITTDREEAIYNTGLAHGIVETVRFLAQSGIEESMERKVNTVDDLINWNS